jgi:hypothetical protein
MLHNDQPTARDTAAPPPRTAREAGWSTAGRIQAPSGRSWRDPAGSFAYASAALARKPFRPLWYLALESASTSPALSTGAAERGRSRNDATCAGQSDSRREKGALPSRLETAPRTRDETLSLGRLALLPGTESGRAAPQRRPSRFMDRGRSRHIRQFGETRGMSTPTWSRSLSNVIGVPLQSVDADRVRAWVSEGLWESEQLDFKQKHYGNSDSQRRELAGDLAAFADQRGGLLVLGVGEDEHGAAASLPLIELADAEQRRIQQIVSGNVSRTCPSRSVRCPSMRTAAA